MKAHKTMSKQDILYIVIPAYNEADNITNVINEWYPIVEKYNGNKKSRLVILNDGSKDNTAEIAKNLCRTKPLLLVIDKANSGHGATVLYGYKYALKNKADFIFQTDSDGQTRPEEFHQFWTQESSRRWFIEKIRYQSSKVHRQSQIRGYRYRCKCSFQANESRYSISMRPIYSTRL